MTKEFTECIKVRSSVKRASCEAVAKAMNAEGFCYTGFFWRDKKFVKLQCWKDVCHVRSREIAIFQVGIFCALTLHAALRVRRVYWSTSGQQPAKSTSFLSLNVPGFPCKKKIDKRH